MDNLTPSQRLHTMRAVKSKNSSAEVAVRRFCRELAEPGYRLHRRDVPGSPDLAYMGRRLAVFVHGCFWHGHSCKAGAKVPKTNADYWLRKIAGNIARDERHLKTLQDSGWATLVVWECEVKDTSHVKRKLAEFLRRR
jgi:DNA mismatch endonuclease (patch repair protein)